METLITRQNTLLKVAAVWIKESSNCMSISASAECANVQLVESTHALKEAFKMWSKFCMVPRWMRPKLEMVNILHTDVNIVSVQYVFNSSMSDKEMLY